MTHGLHDTCSPAGVGPAPCATTPTIAEPLATLERFRREAAFGTLTTGSARSTFFSWGQGPPLLLVPGLALDLNCFAFVCSRLMPHFRCVACDLPARGARLTLPDLVYHLHALLDHLHVTQSSLLGFSFGSTVVLSALRRRPERFPRAVLVGGFAQRTLAPAEVLLARLLRHCNAPMRRLPWYNTILRRSHFRPFADKPPVLWDFFLEQSGTVPIASVAERALLLHSVDLRADLPQIRQPVLLVQGDEDPLVPAACRDELARGLPNAVPVELPDCGHYGLLTHPDALAELVRHFLSDCPGESCGGFDPAVCGTRCPGK